MKGEEEGGGVLVEGLRASGGGVVPNLWWIRRPGTSKRGGKRKSKENSEKYWDIATNFAKGISER